MCSSNYSLGLIATEGVNAMTSKWATDKFAVIQPIDITVDEASVFDQASRLGCRVKTTLALPFGKSAMQDKNVLASRHA